MELCMQEIANQAAVRMCMCTHSLVIIGTVSELLVSDRVLFDVKTREFSPTWLSFRFHAPSQ